MVQGRMVRVRFTASIRFFSDPCVYSKRDYGGTPINTVVYWYNTVQHVAFRLALVELIFPPIEARCVLSL